MAVYRAKTEGAEGEATNYTLKTPSSTVVGDLLVIPIFVTTESAISISGGGISGATVNAFKSGGSTFAVITVKAAEAGEKTLTIAWGGVKQFRIGSVAAYKEVNGTTPVAAVVKELRAANKVITVPSVTPKYKGCLDVIVSMAAAGVSAGAAGFTTRINRFPEYVADKALTKGSASGTATIEYAAAEGPVVFRLALTPVTLEEEEPEKPTLASMQVVGHSYSTGLGVTTAQRATKLVAEHFSVAEDNKGVSGAVLTSDDKAVEGSGTGGFATAANQLVRLNVSPYARCVEYGCVWYGINDIAFIDSTWSSAAQSLVKHGLRFATSRMVAAKVFDDNDASIAYSGFTSNPNSEKSGTGTTNHLAEANGKTVTITVPSDFPGGTVAVYCGGFTGTGAVFACKVDGAAAGSLDTRAASTIKPASHESALMFCKRFAGLAAGTHTIVLTTESIEGAAVFDSWAIEAVTPPTTFLMGQFKLPTKGYEAYASLPPTHTPTDADIEALETINGEVAEEFPSNVHFVSLASMDKTTKLQSEGIHPNAEGHVQIAGLMNATVGGEPEPAPTPGAVSVRVREFPRLDLHYEIQTPAGRFYRWAKDEVRPENVPSGAGFSTTDHGGFDSQNLTLPRKPGVEYADLERLSTVRALGAGGEAACETRLKEAPRTSGDQIAVSPVAEGWIAHLEDDQTAAEIYRDVDLGGWGEASRARSVTVEGESKPIAGASEVLVDPTSGLPSLRLHIDGHWETVTPRAEAWYDAGPNCRIAKVHYDFAGYNDTAFLLIWISAVGDNSITQFSADLYSAVSGSGTAEGTEARRYFAWLWTYASTPAGVDGFVFPVDLRQLAVYGDHGLPVQGTEPEAGFLGDQILGDALSRWAPLLNFSTGSSGSIRPGTFVIPHLAFKEQTTPLAILEGVNRFELRPYFVWEDRTFHWQEWGEGRKWRARVAPTQLSETGPSTDRLRNGVLLKWNDVDGTSKSAGPIGSGSDIESTELEDRDPENPANQLGIPFWGTPFDLGIVTVDSEAVRIGVLLQARLKEVDRSGQAEIVGVCEDDKGVLRPYWQVRAGDTITFIDAADTSERRIIATQADDDSRKNTITLDAPADGTDDLLAQLGVGNTELGL